MADSFFGRSGSERALVLTPEMTVLLASAASIAFLHTLAGPDHYLPFVSMGLARGWSWRKVLGVTLACGGGHVAGSVLLGLLGIYARAELEGLVRIESWRGDLAAWLLLTVGLLYLAWGIRHAGRHVSHHHSHSRPQWALFVVFVLGPCEPLIPVLMYPAAQASVTGVLLVTAVFGLVTLVTMSLAVLLTFFGLKGLRLPRVERYGHALAGATISACGASILAFGL
jgi:hypothetical protein